MIIILIMLIDSGRMMYDAFVEVSRDETVKERLKEKIISFWRYLKNDLIVHNEYMYIT
jgi:hypothetical protein